ncbi:MAG: hypothetical protein JRE23_13235 [Deltaproteobacteria bacterium]|nr:hypothetical protein [Deltaproteobacteria bacterium]
MTKEQLKQKYNGKKIGEIEREIEENRGISFEAQRETIFALSYLRMTGRYKENAQYRKSGFETYLKGQYNMRIGTFLENERAVIHYPEIAKQYGIGLVAKIHRKCGARKEATVFREIKESQGKGPIKQAKIETIIAKYTPAPSIKAPVVDWQAKYEAEARAHKETKRLVNEAKKQIEKLKATVVELRPLRDMKAAIEPFMIPKKEAPRHVS